MSNINTCNVFLLGEEVAFYFAWMSYFRWALCIPAVLGSFVYFWRNPGITVDDNFLLPIYALVMVIWAIFFTVVRAQLWLTIFIGQSSVNFFKLVLL